jgi:acyl-CoA synthetase (NDP forming)
LLRPRSIAIIGASDSALKVSGRPLANLKRYGFRGRILPVNPNRPLVQGLRAYADLSAIPGDIDLAMIMLPAGQTPDAIRACGKRGIPVAIVSASGFAELGADGAGLQRELRLAIAESGVRVLGPNCLGLINVTERAVPTFSTALDDMPDLKPGPVGFLSQSGAFGGFVFSEAQNLEIGVSQYISTGNELDISAAELLDFLVTDGDCTVVLAYLEGVTSGRRLLDAARRANDADVAVIAVKVGRSTAGISAVRSHTASLAGEDAVFDGAARQFGIVRVDGPEAMLDAAQVFATGRRPRGRRLTTLSHSGGAGALMADAAAASDIEVRPWSAAWQQEMAAVIPGYGSPRNPVDLTGTLIAEPGLLAQALDVVLRHPDTDMIAVLLGCADGISGELLAAIEDAYRRTDRPLVVVWTGGSGRPRERLRQLGIPCYPDPVRAARALGLLADYSLRRKVSRPRRPPGIDTAGARAVIAEARAAGQVRLDELQSARLIGAYGVPYAASRPAASESAAVAAARELGGAVAVKLLSSHVSHKSDIGGVRLGLTGPETIRQAARELLAVAAERGLPDGRVLVQRMAPPGRELIFGVKNDSVFGPSVVVGLGGILAEAMGDSQVGIAPVDTHDAMDLLRSLRSSRHLDEYRGQPPADVHAAAEAITRLSWLAADLADDVAELDVNPAVLGPRDSGLVAVDALVMLRPADDHHSEHA